MSEKYRMISELKLNDYLKIDGRKVDVLLLGLRNAYHLHQKFKPQKGRLLFLVNEAARLHFTLLVICRISGNRKSSSHLHAATAALH